MEVRTLAEWEQAGQKGVLSVVIPAHNEEGQIRETVLGLHKTLSDAEIKHEILVVNDNSTDGTVPELRRLLDEVPGFRWVNNEPPHGFGFAVRRGLAEFSGEAVCIVMADASDGPDDVVKFWRKIEEGYDCAFGSRFMRGAKIEGYPWFKRVINRTGNFFIKCMFLMRYNDTTNAFKMFRREVIAGVQPLLAYHFNLTVELPLKSIVRGYKYAVVPNSWYGRKEGVSKF